MTAGCPAQCKSRRHDRSRKSRSAYLAAFQVGEGCLHKLRQVITDVPVAHSLHQGTHNI